MTKTLAQLKRDLTVGTKLKCIRNIHIKDFEGTVRTIKHADTTGVYLSDDMESSRKGSFLGFPKANRLVYSDDTFGLYTQDVCEMIYQIIK